MSGQAQTQWIAGAGIVCTPTVDGGRHEIQVHEYVIRDISDASMKAHEARGAEIVNLIAAAPDMLAALRLLDNGYKYSTEVCNIARAAIAKAEGRS